MHARHVGQHAAQARQPQAELPGLILLDLGDLLPVAAGGDEQVARGQGHDVEEGEAQRGAEHDERRRGEELVVRVRRGGRRVARAYGAEGAAWEGLLLCHGGRELLARRCCEGC